MNAPAAAMLAADVHNTRTGVLEKIASRGALNQLERYLAAWDRVPMEYLDKRIVRSGKAKRPAHTERLLRYKRVVSGRTGGRERWLKMVEEEIAKGRFHICYDVFAGYQSPQESVRRPLAEDDQERRRWQYSGTAVHPVQVDIPKGLQRIGWGAFEHCEDLIAVSMPDSMREIGGRAFSDCSSLIRVDIPDQVYEIAEAAFSGCTALTQIKLPACLTKIGARAFQGCTALTQVAIPDRVEEIGHSAFEGCISLTAVHVPDTVKSIDHSAFSQCTGLQAFSLPEHLAPHAKHILADMDSYAWRWFRGKLQVNPSLEEVFRANVKRRRKAIAKDVLATEDGELLDRYLALWDKVPLDFLEELIELSVQARTAGVTAMLMQRKSEQYAQSAVEASMQRRTEKRLGTRNRSIADWHRVFVFRDNEAEIVIRGHKGWEAVVEVPAVIGSKPVVAIERWIPRGDSEEKMAPYEVLLPEGMREIRNCAFEDSRLESIRIPTTVTKIGGYAFTRCSNLKKVCLPPGLTRIEGHTFSSCTALESVSIPESVTYIDMDAFVRSGLTEIVLPSKVRDMHVYFLNTNRRILVPRGSITEQTIRKMPSNTLEVYRGFNEEPLPEDARFYANGHYEEYSSGERYYPVRVVASWPLDQLPRRKVFLDTLEPPEPDAA